MKEKFVVLIALLLAAAAGTAAYFACREVVRRRTRKMLKELMKSVRKSSDKDIEKAKQQLEINKEKYTCKREYPPEHAQAILHHSVVARKAFSDMRQADEAIKREFWKSGGLRFYTERLLGQLQDTASDADAEAMRVDLYFSLVEPVRERLAVLRGRVREAEESKRKMQAAEEKLRELGEEKVLETENYLEMVYAPRHIALYERLIAVYESRDALLLEGEAASAADMHAAAQRLAPLLQKLLHDYSIPA